MAVEQHFLASSIDEAGAFTGAAARNMGDVGGVVVSTSTTRRTAFPESTRCTLSASQLPLVDDVDVDEDATDDDPELPVKASQKADPNLRKIV